MLILDITNSEFPDSIGCYDTPGSAYDIYVLGDYAYVADDDCGLQIVDISNPTDPSFINEYDTPGRSYGIIVRDMYAYVADYTYGLQIIDVSDYDSLDLVGNYNTPGHAHDLFVSGDTVFMADGSFGIQIISTTDPANPVLLSNYDTPGNANEVFISDEYIYVADVYSFMILRINASSIVDWFNEYPENFILSGNYPNPFNSSTVISYSLPYQSDVTVEIYDILGRKVETLLGDSQLAGYHSIIWKSGENSSGIYFYKIQAGKFVETKKMVLMK
jgi:hypothetical protein